MHEYVGNIHIHSRFSDGTGTVPEIIRAGQRAGLDFIIITDHRTLDALPYQGWHGRLFVLVGEELGMNTGHYLGLGLEKKCTATAPQAMIDEVRAQGGAGFIAHPHDIKIPWPDWRVHGYDGLSLWNYCSQWRGNFHNIPALLYYVLFPDKGVASPPEETRRLWDARNSGGRLMPVIGCSDAHAFGIRPLGLQLVILPYRRLFRAISTYVLLPQPLSGQKDEDERLILSALRQGSSYIANLRRGPGSGFRFLAERDGTEWGMGSAVRYEPGLRLVVSLPEVGGIVLLRDGEVCRSDRARGLSLEAPGPGVYRVEVYAGKWGWIFSNPIGLTRHTRSGLRQQ